MAGILAQGAFRARQEWVSMSTPRRGVMEFSVVDLCELLTPYAKLKVPPFADWEGSFYAKSRRGQGPDRAGLKTYHTLLKSILLVCPSGFPSHVRLRETWLYLNKRHGIMHPELVALCKDPIAWADELADRFKLMLKHVVDLSDSRSTFVTPPVKELMSMVVDTRAGGQASASDVLVAPPPAPHPAMAAIRDQEAPFALSQQSGASSSVVLCSMTCNCPDC